ncbi:hypothetical protein [Streptomyces anulatus]|nr:hypothetical protein [Streptomyces anulatus]
MLAAHGGDEAVTTAIGARLPVLHHHAREFTAAQPDLCSPLFGEHGERC